MVDVVGNRKSQLQREFEVFHAENPHVYELFCRFAMQAIDAGREKFGARSIWERMRWYVAFETTGDDDYKLNDHHPPYYARMFMREHQECEGFFETRRVLGEER